MKMSDLKVGDAYKVRYDTAPHVVLDTNSTYVRSRLDSVYTPTGHRKAMDGAGILCLRLANTKGADHSADLLGRYAEAAAAVPDVLYALKCKGTNAAWATIAQYVTVPEGSDVTFTCSNHQSAFESTYDEYVKASAAADKLAQKADKHRAHLTQRMNKTVIDLKKAGFPIDDVRPLAWRNTASDLGATDPTVRIPLSLFENLVHTITATSTAEKD